MRKHSNRIFARKSFLKSETILRHVKLFNEFQQNLDEKTFRRLFYKLQNKIKVYSSTSLIRFKMWAAIECILESILDPPLYLHILLSTFLNFE